MEQNTPLHLNAVWHLLIISFANLLIYRVTPAATRLLRWRWTAASCCASASGMNRSPKSSCTLSISTTSSATWKCQRSTSPLTHSPPSRQEKNAVLTHTSSLDLSLRINQIFFYAILQDLLTRHKVLVAEFLEQNYDAVSRVCVCVLCTCLCREFSMVLLRKLKFSLRKILHRIAYAGNVLINPPPECTFFLQDFLTVQKKKCSWFLWLNYIFYKTAKQQFIKYVRKAVYKTDVIIY